MNRNPKIAAAHWEIARASLMYLWRDCVAGVVPPGASALFSLVVDDEESEEAQLNWEYRHRLFTDLLEDSSSYKTKQSHSDSDKEVTICVTPKE